MFRIDQVITWVHVPKPTLDLVGIVLGAMAAAAFCAVVALLLGSTFGLFLVARGRRRREQPPPPILGLVDAPR